MPVLNILESIKLAEKHGIKFAKHAVVRRKEGLASACRSVGFPLVMKVVSSKITHKTDVGGVAVGVKSLGEARQAYLRMKKLPGFEGVLVQEFAQGREIIIGGKQDVQFGPTVLFGLGGIFVEVFRDFSVGICPLAKKDAQRMVKGVKSYSLLKGIRGAKPVNLAAVEDALLKVSALMCLEPKVKEIDLNPLMANEKGVVAVDARVVV